jgi:hypothetical protein
MTFLLYFGSINSKTFAASRPLFSFLSDVNFFYGGVIICQRIGDTGPRHTHATRYFLTALFHHFKRFNPILYNTTDGGASCIYQKVRCVRGCKDFDLF